MKHSIAVAERQEQGNLLAPALPLIGVVPEPQVERDNLWVLPILAEAIDSVMSRKEAALRIGVSEPTLSRQLAGVEGKCMNFAGFGKLGDAVAIAFCERLRTHFGLDDPAERTKQAVAMVTRGLSILVGEVTR